MRKRLVLTVVTVAALTSAALGVGVAIEPKFYSDDPILRDPETQNASGVQEIDISEATISSRTRFRLGRPYQQARRQREHDR